MIVDVRLPQLGMGMVDAEVVEWRKEVGDPVVADEPLVEVDAGKVVTEMPAPVSGTLVRIAVAAGETVEVGHLLAQIETS